MRIYMQKEEKKNTLSAYFGAIDSLSVKTGIPMGENHFGRYECLVKEKTTRLGFQPL